MVKYANVPISDAHIHVFWNMTLDKREALLSRVIEECGYDTVTVLSQPLKIGRVKDSALISGRGTDV